MCRFYFVILAVVAQILAASAYPCPNPCPGYTTVKPISYAPLACAAPVVTKCVAPPVSTCACPTTVVETVTTTVSPCNYELVLPPPYLELPYGLGFREAALPVVAAAYGAPCDTVLEAVVSSPCGTSVNVLPVPLYCGCSATIATPFSPCIGGLVRPIIL